MSSSISSIKDSQYGDAEIEARVWIKSVIGSDLKNNEPLGSILKSGVLLCELVNSLEPGLIPKIDDSKMNFKQMENIKRFLRACRSLGVKEHDVFETNDLFEEKDMRSVVRCILALKRAMKTFESGAPKPPKQDISEGKKDLETQSNHSNPNTPPRIEDSSIPSYDTESISELVIWMEGVLGVKNDIPPIALAQCLKDGVILCNLANCLKPGIITKINQSEVSYKIRENVTAFLRACTTLGVPESELCDPNDVMEENTQKIVKCLYGLGRVIPQSVPEYQGPQLWPERVKSSNESNRHATPEREREAKQWITERTGIQFFEGDLLATRLHNGVVLCTLMNKIAPSFRSNAIPVVKIDESRMPFKQMENIKKFLQLCRACGLADHEIFETNDLFDGKDIRAVVNCILALKRIVQLDSEGVTVEPNKGSGDSKTNSPARMPGPLSLPNASTPPSPGSAEKPSSTVVSPSQESVSSVTPELELAVITWIEAVVKGLHLDVPPSTLTQCLRDGVVLCNLMNSLKPGIVPRVNQSDVSYKVRENIMAFLRACTTLGVPEGDVFEATEITEDSRDRLIKCLFSLARTVEVKLPGYSGPRIRMPAGKTVPTKDEELAKEWIQEVTGTSLPEDIPIGLALKDGILLCELMNVLLPGCIARIERSKLVFRQMENIKKFLQACRTLGLDDIYIFETNDLFELKDIKSVLNCILALKRVVQQRLEAGEPLVPGTPTNSNKHFASESGEELPEDEQGGGSRGAGEGGSFTTPSRPQSISLPQKKLIEQEESEVVKWIEGVLMTHRFDIPPLTLAECLKDGVVLCKMINQIKPGMISKINQTDLQPKMEENAKNFLQACKTLGVQPDMLFSPLDLIQEKNIRKVIKCVIALARSIPRSVPTYRGPLMAENIGRKADEGDSTTVAKEWISALTGYDLSDEEPLASKLKNGIILCELMNKLVPGSIQKIEVSKLPFKQMENIKKFLQLCRACGLADHEIFETNDLFDGKNMRLVLNCILALKRVTQSWDSIAYITTPTADTRSGYQYSSQAQQSPPTSSDHPPQPPQSPPQQQQSLSPPTGGVANGVVRSPDSEGVIVDVERSEFVEVGDGQQVEEVVEATAAVVDEEPPPITVAFEDLQSDVITWMEAVLWCVKFDVQHRTLPECLYDGVTLCQLVNSIKPGSIEQIYANTGEEEILKNVVNFVYICISWGVTEEDLFEVEELIEKKNPKQLVRCLAAFGEAVKEAVPEYEGPKFICRAAENII